MKLMCVLFTLCLLQIAMFITVKGKTPNSVEHRQAEENDEVPRVKIKVFRGPTEEIDGELIATWGYWIKQPSR